jgi:NAD-dependent dihydropyrimidine dehydrogenase PreA subunit
MARAPERVIINHAECRGCGLCILACPAGCLGFADDYDDLGYHPVRYSGEGCRADGLCSSVCPRPGAITILADPDGSAIGRRP